MFIPALPSIVIAPSDVEKLDAAAASSDKAEDASILIAAPSISTVCPAPFSVSVPPVDVAVMPPAPDRVNVPAEVVKLEAAPASRDIVSDESIVVVVLSISTLPFKSVTPLTVREVIADSAPKLTASISPPLIYTVEGSASVPN